MFATGREGSFRPPALLRAGSRIESKYHFVVSLVIGAGAALAWGLPPSTGALAVAGAVVLGVGIDLDHFLIARANAGNWRALAFCLRNPVSGLLDQSEIFDAAEVGAAERLVTHLVAGAGIVLVAGRVDSRAGWLAAAVLYAHLLADVVHDLRRERERRR